METRSEAVLDAAIEVLGARGARHLTHRAVDALAGLPVGSTSNLFRSREALLAGVLRRVLEQEAAAWWKISIGLRPASVGAFASVIGELLRDVTDTGRVRTLARRAAFLEAAREPVLRGEIERAQAEIATWLTPALGSLGSRDPAADARLLLALMDGLIGHQLVNPRPDFEPSTAIEALLRGLISAHDDPVSSGGVTPRSPARP
jgi:DNA-binding transcriptional regulator YbjK